MQFFCSMARCDLALCRHCWLLFFLCLLRAWLSPSIFTSQLLFSPCFFSLCLPSDASSSSKRLMPVFCVRVWRLDASWLDGAVLADVFSPIRSSRAEPGAEKRVSVYDLSEQACTKTTESCRSKHTHVHLLGGRVVMSSADTSSPFTSCLYRLMTWVRLSLACKISAGNGEK